MGDCDVWENPEGTGGWGMGLLGLTRHHNGTATGVGGLRRELEA